MSLEHRITIGRRKFLQGLVTSGLAFLTQRLLSDEAVWRQAVDEPQPPPPTEELDHRTYLPLISRQGPAAHGPSKLGLHTIRPNKAVEFVRSVHDAGAHVALVKALDDFGYIRQVKEISPQTVTVGRWNKYPAVDPSGDPAEKAAWLMDLHMERWEYEKDVMDYWELQNENAPSTIEGHVWLAQFFIAAMEIAENNGYKLALFSYSVGVPKWHDWEAIVETGVFARAKEGGHVLALHEYNWAGSSYGWGEPTEDLPPYEDRGILTGRYRYLYRDFLIPRGEVVPLAITEGGLDPVLRKPGQPTTWKERYVEEMIWYDTKLREDDYVLGVALFTIGSSGITPWTHYDYEELLWPGNPYGSNFLDYIVSLKDA
ncbi:MAG: hypothetical protein DRI48_00895 [Chloroflexi bacterium]|nr:MAG: hypothetical protein DRI48_00895 [Chloroflexota bacterium]